MTRGRRRAALLAGLVLLLAMTVVVLVIAARPDPLGPEARAPEPRAASSPSADPVPEVEAIRGDEPREAPPGDPDELDEEPRAWSGFEFGEETRPEPEPIPRRTIRGHLLRTDGEPVRKATVTFLHVSGNHSWSRVEGRVAADGSFEIPGVPEDWIRGGIEFEAGAGGFLTQTYGMHADDLVSGASIVLRAAIRVRGRFVDEEGRPVAGVSVSGFHGPYNYVSARSDAEGRVAFRWPAGRGGAIYRRHRNYPDGLFRWPASPSDVDAGDTVLRPARDLGGIVLGPDGAPRAGAVVELYGTDLFGRLMAATKTDAEGRYSFGKRGDGIFEVFTSRKAEIGGRPATLGARAIGLRAGDPPVTLAEGPLRTIRLRLLDARTKKPTTAVCFTVRLRRPGEDRFSLRQWREVVSEPVLHATETGEHELFYSTPFHGGETTRLRFEETPRTVEIELRAAGDR